MAAMAVERALSPVRLAQCGRPRFPRTPGDPTVGRWSRSKRTSGRSSSAIGPVAGPRRRAGRSAPAADARQPYADAVTRARPGGGAARGGELLRWRLRACERAFARSRL